MLALSEKKELFYPRNGTKLGLFGQNGIRTIWAPLLFSVSTNGEFNNGKDNRPKIYNYSVPAVDAVDQAAKMHDQGYDNLRAEGSSGLFSDFGTTPVDEAAVNSWNGFLKSAKVGGKDPFTGQKITSDEIGAAQNAVFLFYGTINSKKIGIFKFYDCKLF